MPIRDTVDVASPGLPAIVRRLRSAAWVCARGARRSVLRLMFLVAALGVAAGAIQAAPLGEAELEAQLKRLVGFGAPGAIALIETEAGRTIAAAGVADRQTGRAVTPADVFRIASVTKLVTGAIVQMLVVDDELALDDQISRFLPRSLIGNRRITVRQLLNHTSGIPDYLKDPAEPMQVSATALSRTILSPRSSADRIRQALKMPKLPFPGEHEYSNTNYVLLQLIVEKVTGQSFEAVAAELLGNRLGLHATGFPDGGAKLPNPHLRGYVPADGPAGPYSDRSRMIDVTEHTVLDKADGSLFANVTDLANLIDGIWSERLASGGMVARLAQSFKSDHEGLYRYGLGIMELRTRCGARVLGHDGRDLGLYTKVFADRANRRKLVLVINTSLDGVPELERAIDDLQDQVFCR